MNKFVILFTCSLLVHIIKMYLQDEVSAQAIMLVFNYHNYVEIW